MRGDGTPAAPAVSRAGSTRKCDDGPPGHGPWKVEFESPPASEPGASASTWPPAWSWAEATQQQKRRHGTGPRPTSRARSGCDHNRTGRPICSKCRIYDHKGHYGVALWSLQWTQALFQVAETVGTQGNPANFSPSNGVKMPPEAVFRLYSLSVSSESSFSDIAGVRPLASVDGLSSAQLPIGSRS